MTYRSSLLPAPPKPFYYVLKLPNADRNSYVVMSYHKIAASKDDLAPVNSHQKAQIMKGFGTNLKRLRLEKNLSLRELGVAADMEHKHIEAIEKGQINPTLSTVYGLAYALDLNPSDLVSFKLDQ